MHEAPGMAKSLRVMILTNVIAPYQKPVFDQLAARFGELRILLSTRMEPNRPWRLEWEGLDVRVQKTITVRRRWRHPRGFSEPLFVHVPIDTIPQLARYRPHVVISWELGIRTIQAALYRRFSRSKLLVWAEFAESTEFGRGRMRQMIRRILHHFVDGFLVTGESGVRYLKAIGVPSHKLHKIVYTTNIERFAHAPCRCQTSEPRRLLYVGQLIERKNLLPFLKVLIDWARLHPECSISFTLAGDGPLRTQLETQPFPPNLLLRFLGNLPYQQLPGIYAQADIFAFPTLADTWGVVVNEAFAAGVPVLGSLYSQAVAELVCNEQNGWTFHPDRGEEMFEALDRALNATDQQLALMRECARETAMRLTPEYVAELVERGILACISEKREAAA